jgi:predicted negative regulator of RcsB-dependent stress response
METYLSEEQRLEALQRWWKENRSSIAGGVILGIVIIVGWSMWQSNQRAIAEQASNLYQQLTRAVEAKQSESAVKLGERLIEQYGSSAYAEYARLFLAKLKVEAGDLSAAKKILEEELAKSDDDNLKALARLRLGRTMLAAGEIDPALKLIEPATNNPKLGKFAGLYEELKGDLLAAANRPEDARRAYEKAKASGEASPLLELKLNDLPAAADSAS